MTELLTGVMTRIAASYPEGPWIQDHALNIDMTATALAHRQAAGQRPAAAAMGAAAQGAPVRSSGAPYPKKDSTQWTTKTTWRRSTSR